MRTHIWLSAACVALSVACSGGSPSSSPGASGAPAAAGGGQINGAGATFPNPIYSKWFFEYNKAHPDVRINYQSLGSGRRNPAADGPHGVLRRLGPADEGRTAGGGAGEDPALPHCPRRGRAHLQPGRHLAAAEVHRAAARRHRPRQGEEVERPGHRQAQPRRRRSRTRTSRSCTAPTDRARRSSSPTTLAKVSPEFKARSGVDASLKWPVGVGGKGNEGVAGLVRQTPGSLGYVELVYAVQNKIAVGAVQNSPGSSSRRRSRA